jgi:hypothetical protein
MVFNFMGGSAAVVENIKGAGHRSSISTEFGHTASIPDFDSTKCDKRPNLAPYRIHSGDSCYSVASKYYMTLSDLQNLNEDALGHSGCKDMLEAGTILCVRTTSVRW